MIYRALLLFTLLIPTIMSQEKESKLTLGEFRHLKEAEQWLPEVIEAQGGKEKYIDNMIKNRNFKIVTATVYNPVESQTDSTPGITASGFEIDTDNPYRHRIIAVSRDLFGKLNLNYGDHVLIEGDLPKKYRGVFRVEDTMNDRFTNRIDFLTDDSKGKWKVKIKKL